MRKDKNMKNWKKFGIIEPYLEYDVTPEILIPFLKSIRYLYRSKIVFGYFDKLK